MDYEHKYALALVDHLKSLEESESDIHTGNRIRRIVYTHYKRGLGKWMADLAEDMKL